MILDDLCIYLNGKHSLTDGTNLFAQELPDTPSKAVVVREYAGPPSVETFGSDLEAEEVYAVQVVCRDTTTPLARTLSHKVHRSLRAIAPTTSMNSGLRYLAVVPGSMPFPLSLDDDQRVTYVCNYTITRDAPVTIT